MSRDPTLPHRRPPPTNPLSIILLLLILATFWSVTRLQTLPGSVQITRGGLSVAAAFVSRAISPALRYESTVPSSTAPLLVKALTAAQTTVIFGAAAISLATVGGIAFGFFASTAWWPQDVGDTRSRRAHVGRVLRPAAYLTTRVLIAVLRSTHELLWAVLLLAAFGLGHLTAVLAIAIPYAGVLAKVFSEMIDETPRDAAVALREAGGSSLQVFLFGLLPRVLPEMTAYVFYRFECALRSSAVLGFFGFPTLGYFIAASFENLLYGEVWTYLYMLFALVVVMDWWSGALRRRIVA